MALRAAFIRGTRNSIKTSYAVRKMGSVSIVLPFTTLAGSC